LQAQRIEWVEERQYTLAAVAQGLAGASRWRVRLLTPWSASRSDLGADGRTVAMWLRRFPELVAQKAKKLVALDMADRHHAGLPALQGLACHELGLRARDEGAWPALRGLYAAQAHLALKHRHRASLSNAHAVPLHLVRGCFELQAPESPGAAQAAAPWLAMLQAMGGGADTSEGHGAVDITPLGSGSDKPA